MTQLATAPDSVGLAIYTSTIHHEKGNVAETGFHLYEDAILVSPHGRDSFTTMAAARAEANSRYKARCEAAGGHAGDNAIVWRTE